MSAGIYGKLPSMADFCRQRLPNTFVEPWDRWLQQCLTEARETLGERWHKSYLSSPLWGFAVDAGVVSEVGWAGVLATSVDSTGRYYPLTLAFSIEKLLPAQSLALSLQVPLRELEARALALIEGECGIDEVLRAMQTIDTGLQTLDTLAEEPLLFASSYGAEMGALLSNPLFPPVDDLRRVGFGALSRQPRPANMSIWWHYGWPGRAPEAVRARGLPQGAMFAGFLDGRWEDHGWRR